MVGWEGVGGISRGAARATEDRDGEKVLCRKETILVRLVSRTCDIARMDKGRT